MEEAKNTHILRTGEDKNWIWDLALHSTEDREKLCAVCKALGNEVRLEIYANVVDDPMRLSEISRRFNLSHSATLHHIGVLKDAGLVYIDYEPAKKGAAQVVYNAHVGKILLDVYRKENVGNGICTYILDMPVGQYVDATGDERVRYVCADHKVRESAFFPDHVDAIVVWFYKSGHLSYLFPTDVFRCYKAESVEFTVELCSEAPHYRNEWKSDVEFLLNGKKLCDYTCPGDFGDRSGLCSDLEIIYETHAGTQYGQLVSVKVDESGVWLNQRLVSKDVTFSSLGLAEMDNLTLTMRVDKDAEHVGGLNVFGRKAGDFAQDIRMIVIYREGARAE